MSKSKACEKRDSKIAIASSLTDFVKSPSNFEVLSLVGNFSLCKNIEELKDNLSKAKNLSQIFLDACSLSDKNVEETFKIYLPAEKENVDSYKSIMSTFSFSMFKESYEKEVSPILITKAALKTLSLAKNHLSDDSVDFIIKLAKHNPSLEVLNLAGNEFTEEGRSKIHQGLEDGTCVVNFEYEAEGNKIEITSDSGGSEAEQSDYGVESSGGDNYKSEGEEGMFEMDW